MKIQKKKKPSDYPLFSFRVTQADKEFLLSEIGAVEKILNKNLGEGEKKFRGNHVVIEALKIGLKTLKRQK